MFGGNQEKNEFEVWFAPEIDGLEEAEESLEIGNDFGSKSGAVNEIAGDRLLEKIDRQEMSKDDEIETEKAADDLLDKGLGDKLQKLEELAYERGIRYTTGVVRKTNNPYLIDRFSDFLKQHYKELKM